MSKFVTSKMIWAVLGACIAPFGIVSIYILLARLIAGFLIGTGSYPSVGSSRIANNLDRALFIGDYTALIVGIAFGIFFILCLPITLRIRTFVSILYVPIIGYLLYYYPLVFVALVFGEGP